MDFIKNLETASTTRWAFYTAVAGTIAVILVIISSVLETNKDKPITLYVMIIGIIWSGMFGAGTVFKFMNPGR